MEMQSMDIPSSPKPNILLSEARILKNLSVICIAFILLFSSYMSLANLQSTLNIEANIGVTSQSVLYAAFILSAMFLPKLMISKLGYKKTLVLSTLLYAPYVAANFYPHMATFVVTALFIGCGAGPLWATKCTLLKELSSLYASHRSEDPDLVITRFFGIFFMAFQSTQIWGNLLSYYVLRPTDDIMEEQVNVISSSAGSQNITCGYEYCSNINNNNLFTPNVEQRYILMSVFLCLTLIAAAVVGLFLDSLPIRNTGSGILSSLSATIKHLKNIDQLLLVPLTIFSGIEQAFIWGDYTKAYIGCAWGVYQVGLVFVCFGVVNAVASLASGCLIRFMPRVFLFTVAALINVIVSVVLLYWEPKQYSLAFFFVGLWGVADAIWQTQVNALYGVLFICESEAAFSNYRLWESFGLCIAFGYSSLLCVDQKIYILLVFLAVGMLGYLTVDLRFRHKTKISK